MASYVNVRDINNIWTLFHLCVTMYADIVTGCWSPFIIVHLSYIQITLCWKQNFARKNLVYQTPVSSSWNGGMQSAGRPICRYTKRWYTKHPAFGWASSNLHTREMTRSLCKPSLSGGTAYAFMHSDVAPLYMAHWNCQGQFICTHCLRLYRIIPVL